MAHAMDVRTAQSHARLAGILVLTSVAAGFFGEAYVPMTLVKHGDPIQTARNIVESESLFRLGFGAYLVEAVCDTALTCLLYLLLRAVRHDVALLGAFFRLIGTAVFAAAEVFYFAMLALAGGTEQLTAFPPDQRHSLVMLSHTFSSHGQSLANLFYGAGSIVFGYLIAQSVFLPRFVGVLFAVSGVGFIIKTVTWVLAPAYSSYLLLIPVGIAALVLGLWLAIKGIHPESWARATQGPSRETFRDP